MGKAQLQEITAYLVHETNGAILICDGEWDQDRGDWERKAWLPKSEIEFDVDYRKAIRGAHEVEVTVPEWLFIDKKLDRW